MVTRIQQGKKLLVSGRQIFCRFLLLYKEDDDRDDDLPI